VLDLKELNQFFKSLWYIVLKTNIKWPNAWWHKTVMFQNTVPIGYMLIAEKD